MPNSYDLIAAEWHARERGPAYVERVLEYIDGIVEGVPRGARVLDLGCGTGEPIARHLVEKGYRVTGIDDSRAMLEIARRTVPEAELINANMIDCEFPGRFAAAVAWDSMFHVERKHHGAIYRKLANALEDGGRILLSVGGSDSNGESKSEGFTAEMFGETFFYSGYDPETARRLIETAGFKIELWEVDDPTSRGHIAIIARLTSMSGLGLNSDTTL